MKKTKKNCTLCLHDQKIRTRIKASRSICHNAILRWWPEANYLTHWLAFFEWGMTNIFSFHVYIYERIYRKATNAQHAHILRDINSAVKEMFCAHHRVGTSTHSSLVRFEVRINAAIPLMRYMSIWQSIHRQRHHATNNILSKLFDVLSRLYM